MSKQKAWAVLPARLESTRLPRKLLLSQTGIPLIEHTYKQVVQAKRIEKVLVATDSEEIEEACLSFGANVVRTGKAESGTARICQALDNIESDLIVNVQADEPEINPGHIDRAVDALASSRKLGAVTLARPLEDWKEILSPSQVKVVVNDEGNAIYFSRSPIPVCMDDEEIQVPKSAYLGHVGLYAYRKATLEAINKLPTPKIAEMEQLEQLKFLHYGMRVRVLMVRSAEKGIDTTVDYSEFVARKTKRKKLTRRKKGSDTAN